MHPFRDCYIPHKPEAISQIKELKTWFLSSIISCKACLGVGHCCVFNPKFAFTTSPMTTIPMDGGLLWVFRTAQPTDLVTLECSTFY